MFHCSNVRDFLCNFSFHLAAKPMKLHTHGFMDTTAGEGTLSKHTYFVNGEAFVFPNPFN